MTRLLICFVLLLVLAPTIAVAQVSDKCRVGVYLNPGGAVGDGNANELYNDGAGRDIYVVIRAEDFVSAVAYTVDIPFLNQDVFLLGRSYGPEGGGLNILTPGGDNIGLGECAIGFNRFPILVETFTLLAPDPNFNKGMVIQLFPNPDADPEAVQYATCQGDTKPCSNAVPLYLMVVGTESRSFGQVKALY